jgi:hypothetical protein
MLGHSTEKHGSQLIAPPPPRYASADDIIQQTPNLIRFKVHDVKSEEYRGKFQDNTHLERSWSTLGRVEYFSKLPDSNIIQSFTKHNAFASAIHKSFFDHYPIRLSPDVLWITILQGLAIHVDQNPEELRDRFVDFEGKETISIMRPDIELGNPNNQWDETIDEFLHGVKARVKPEVHELIECEFSTSTPMDRIAKHVAILDITRHYFRLMMYCGCGIPWIELIGTPDDWKLLRQKAESLERYNMKWWVDALLPVLDEFVDASSGKVNLSFWRSVVFLTGGSGMPGDPITGWMQTFFPYLTSDGKGTYYRNGAVHCWTEDKECVSRPGEQEYDSFESARYGGVSLDSIPSGISQASFTLTHVETGASSDMTYGAGLTAVTYDSESKALEVKTGYAVIEKSNMKGKSNSTSGRGKRDSDGAVDEPNKK